MMRQISGSQRLQVSFLRGACCRYVRTSSARKVCLSLHRHCREHEESISGPQKEWQAMPKEITSVHPQTPLSQIGFSHQPPQPSCQPPLTHHGVNQKSIDMTDHQPMPSGQCPVLASPVAPWLDVPPSQIWRLTHIDPHPTKPSFLVLQLLFPYPG